jgi:glutamate/tyrosine decarboxylase-like PLP-dependent enzyme
MARDDGRTEPELYSTALTEAAARARRYLETIRERHVGVTPAALENLAALGGPLPRSGEQPESILRLLDEVGSPATTASMGGRFFGGVTGGALPTAVAAHWLADVWDQNASLFDFSPVSAFLEDVVLAWVGELLGLPDGIGGAFVTGTQMGDVTALAAARHAVLGEAGWDVESDGLFGAPPITVIVGECVHATMIKALAMLGLGGRRVVVVPADAQGRMIAGKIPRVRGPAIVCAQAGNVNTGAFDPISAICEAARDSGAWVHVDGAFGLWAAASPERKHLVEGMGNADSWATDAHKWLNAPYDCGIAMVRRAETLRRAMAIGASYYPDSAGRREPMQWGPESSRRSRAVEVWAALKSLGADGVAALVERTCRYAEAFAIGLRAAGFEVLNDVVLNQVLVSFGDDETTTRVVAAVQAEGTCWCGATSWSGRKAMRISVSSWATADSDVERSLDAIRTIAASAQSPAAPPSRHAAGSVAPAS